MHMQPILTDIERLAEILHENAAWATIEDLVAACDAGEFWSREFIERAISMAKKARLRELIKHHTDHTGHPQWASITVPTIGGGTLRVYKREAAFEPNDYVQTINYWVQRAEPSRQIAETYRAHAATQHNLQLSLPWDAPARPAPAQS